MGIKYVINLTNFSAPDRLNEFSDNEQTPTDFVYIVNTTVSNLCHHSSLDLYEFVPWE